MPDSFGSLRWAPHLEHIDLTAQRFLQIEDETAEVEDGPARRELDEEVDIAIGPRVPSGHGTDQANVTCSVSRRNGEEFVSAVAEIGERQPTRRLANDEPGPGEHLELDTQRVREPRQGRDSWGDLAALQPGDRGLGGAEPGCKPGLRQSGSAAGRGERAAEGFWGAWTPSGPRG